MARPKTLSKSDRVTVSLDAATHEALRIRAEKDDVAVAWLIRRAVNDMVASWPASSSKKRGGK